MKSLSRTKGFTLVELLVVIGIIALLASVVLANLVAARSKARDAVRRQSLRQIENALDVYYSQNGHYPLTLDVNPVPTTAAQCSGDGNGIHNSWSYPHYNGDTNWIPEIVPKYISTIPATPYNVSSPTCGNAYSYYYKSCDGENYAVVFYCGMESPVSQNDQFHDGARGDYTLKLCRGTQGCAQSGIY